MRLPFGSVLICASQISFKEKIFPEVIAVIADNHTGSPGVFGTKGLSVLIKVQMRC